MMTSASSKMFADHVTGCGCCGSAQQLTHESGTTVKGPRKRFPVWGTFQFLRSNFQQGQTEITFMPFSTTRTCLWITRYVQKNNHTFIPHPKNNHLSKAIKNPKCWATLQKKDVNTKIPIVTKKIIRSIKPTFGVLLVRHDQLLVLEQPQVLVCGTVTPGNICYKFTFNNDLY